MATVMQKRVARRIVKAITTGEDITGGEIVAQAGYSPSVQRKPIEVMEGKGVKEELAILGFSVQKAKEVVSEILGDEDEPGVVRLKAADMVFKVDGTYAAEKHANLNVNVEVTQDEETLSLAAKMYGEALMQKKMQ